MLAPGKLLPHTVNPVPSPAGRHLAQGRSPLESDRWQRAVEIFERIVDLDPASREEALARELSDDANLESIVRGMLDADDTADDVLDRGVDQLAHLVVDIDSIDTGSLQPGDQVGDFEIVSEIGRGGMGIVYAARDRTLGRVAALKLLPARSSADPAATERLVAEAQAASALDHPNVATIYQIGATQDGRRFIAMARYEGETLRERLKHGPIPPRETFDIATQIASGLAAAHTTGLVHRDVKPENVFITKRGLVKLLDFGIATLAGSPREGPTTRGTILYMSPEHARRETPDSRGDVWSLGVVLFEMLTGSPPFTGDSATDILATISSPEPVALTRANRQLPPIAAGVLARALEKDRAKRYPDAVSMLGDLEKATRLWTRTRNVRLAAAAAIVIAAAGAFTWSSANRSATEVTELAVLPVASDVADSASIEILNALTDEIAARVTGLGRVKLVRVRDTLPDSKSAPGLYLLRLSIDRSNDGPRVTGSLQSAANATSIWRESRAFHLEQLPELSRDFTIGVLAALGKPVTPRERSIIGRAFPSNAKAYEQFLLGNRLLAVRTPVALEAALVRYRRATQLDSTFAAAFARQSYAYSVLYDWGWKPTRIYPPDPLAEGLRLADRAVALDSTSADAWLARAYLLVQRDPLRFEGATDALRRAITLDPYNAEAFHQYGQTLTALGDYTEALAAYSRVMDLEPDRAMTLVPMAAIYKRIGRRDEGHRLLDSAISASPRVPYARAARGLVRIHAGDARGAKEDAEFALSVDSSYRIPPLATLTVALLKLGDTAAALTRLNEAERSIVDPRVPTQTEAYWVAMAAVALGENDRALAVLRKARPRGAWLWFYFDGPELDEFRKIPEAAAILSEADPRSRTQ